MYGVHIKSECLFNFEINFEESIMPRKPTKEEVDVRILRSGVDAKTDDVYINAITPMTFYCSKGHKWPAKLGNITHNHQGCPYCSGRYPIVGKTDLWTTNPSIASLLLNKEDGYKFTQYSTHKANFVCPNCGEIINRAIHNTSRRGLSCSVCGDGLSYPNKFMASMLSQLQVYYIPEFHIDGDRYRYDFYIPSHNLIIEMQGRQHYEDWNRMNSNFEDVRHNDELKLKFALSYGVEKYICIDARCSDIGYISSRIKLSELNDLFDLSYIDWKQCGYYASGSLVHTTARLYNDGYDTDEIATQLNVSTSTVCSWLKKATELDLCTWIKSNGFLSDKHTVILLNTKEQFNSIGEGSRMYNVPIQNITQTCQKKRAYAGLHPETGEPMVWRYIEDYDENEIIDFMSLLNPRAHYTSK
jgi:hypothetical protein